MALIEAAFDVARVRLRPILTDLLCFYHWPFASCFLPEGMELPETGPSRTGSCRRVMVGTLIGVFCHSFAYIFFQWLRKKISSKKEKLRPVNGLISHVQ